MDSYTQQLRDKYKEEIRNSDYSHMMSDDHNAWRKGVQEKELLINKWKRKFGSESDPIYHEILKELLHGGN